MGRTETGYLIRSFNYMENASSSNVSNTLFTGAGAKLVPGKPITLDIRLYVHRAPQ
jgi:hypothetical protein